MTLGATVDPGGLATSYSFEYGPTDLYGHRDRFSVGLGVWSRRR